MESSVPAFGWLDYTVWVLYMIFVAYFGLRASDKQQSAKDYFLGGEGLPWWAVLFSVVATETSTLTFISIPVVAYGGNLTFLQITIGYFIGRVIVALVFLPHYFKGEIYTAYTFLERRFGSSMRNATSITFMFTRLLADGVRLFATAIPLAVLLRFGGAFEGWSDFQLYAMAIMSITVLTLLYTFLGGIKAVVWMDVIQMGVYLGGAILAGVLLVQALPDGWQSFHQAVISTGKTQWFDWGWDGSWKSYLEQPYVFGVAIFGGAIFCLASHGTDHLLVQRLLATGSLGSGQKALIGSGFVIILQFLLFLFIGLLLYTFYEGADISVLGLRTQDEIFVKYIIEHIPSGVSGLIVAALFAAAMSSLSSSLNALASTSLYDLIIPYRKKVLSAVEELNLSRRMTLIWGIVLSVSALLFTILQLQAGERPTVVELGLGIASYTYGGLLGAFSLGLMSKKAQSIDALAGFFSGLICLLFMVEGPVQNLLPGEPLALAWPLYTAVGATIVVLIGELSAAFRNSKA
ncbi:MAG: sodium:solute symporter [Balneola sp.]|nr:sodium:solute symporter [Balneola sp.]|tara:strand:+ start:4715 stop:6271 length:1557 start_codon:yes stop_codon:yes gene_type:complete